MIDPAVPPEEAARLVLEAFPDPGDLRLGDHMVLPELGFETAHHSGEERARLVETALHAAAPESVVRLAFGAGVAEQLRDDRLAAELYGRAAELTDDRSVGFGLAATLLELGDLRHALPLIEARARAEPSEDLLYRDAIHEAFERRDLPRRAPCPCGSGRRHARCCGPVERVALERFADRSALERARDALVRFTAALPGLDEAWERWFGRPHRPDPASDELAIEWAAWASPLPGEHVNPLAAFAADASVPQELREIADRWSLDGRWGVWQVVFRDPDPGIVLRDLVTARGWYAEAPAGADLAPWSVVLGLVVPVEGVWRLGTVVEVLTPSEGDALTRSVHERADALIREMARGRARRGPRSEVGRSLPDPYEGLPPSVGVDVADVLGWERAAALAGVTAAAIPDLLTELQEARARPRRIANMEGHPLILLTSRIRVADAGALRPRLAAHPEVEDRGEDLTWLGPEMAPDHAAVARAELRAHAEKLGTDVQEPGEPQRWMRAKARIEGDELVLDTNSVERRDAFLGILRSLGERPEVVDETRVDPALDLAWDAGPGVGADASPLGAPSQEGRDAWAKEWLDAPVPAVDGATPREAARDEGLRPLLEWLLREFEHREWLARRDGLPAADIGRMREELDMTSPFRWHYPPEDDEEERREWAVPRGTGRIGPVDLSTLDPADEDDRRILIEAEHPELREALARGDEQVEVDGETISPKLHIALHEVVASQLWLGEPPEVWETAVRLLSLGYERHEILHMLAVPAATEMWQAAEGDGYDRDRLIAALDALPGPAEGGGSSSPR